MADSAGAIWRKSTRSGNGGNCVEVATNLLDREDAVLVRDSKNPRGGNLAVTARSWAAFTDAVREGALGL
ncbi:DUF397 domain-containing protein [Micromonospora andamanensis]|uniref:DUF397 domain-containing protein n=1 Tax=Micromonospora andamanensis TaxID=1287068 RepID=UPI00195088BB|nr:DUF397 domain-containing protein [Micromonospora andamanensis]